MVFDPGGFSQLLLEFTVFEETFSNRTPCFLLFPLANQLYFDLEINRWQRARNEIMLFNFSYLTTCFFH